MEDPLAQHALFPLDLVSNGFLLLDELSQRRRHREHASLAVLGGPRVQSNDAGGEINLTPLQGQDFARNSPASDIAEAHDSRHGCRKVPDD